VSGTSDESPTRVFTFRHTRNVSSSTPKPPPKPPAKPKHLYQDQLSVLNDLLEKREDISIHEKLDMIIKNQKALSKFMADVMRGGFVGVSQGLEHVPNMRENQMFWRGGARHQVFQVRKGQVRDLREILFHGEMEF